MMTEISRDKHLLDEETMRLKEAILNEISPETAQSILWRYLDSSLGDASKVIENYLNSVNHL
jgi:hypothetical protein